MAWFSRAPRHGLAAGEVRVAGGDVQRRLTLDEWLARPGVAGLERTAKGRRSEFCRAPAEVDGTAFLAWVEFDGQCLDTVSLVVADVTLRGTGGTTTTPSGCGRGTTRSSPNGSGRAARGCPAPRRTVASSTRSRWQGRVVPGPADLNFHIRLVYR